MRGPFRIVGARWGKRIRKLRIRCEPCGREFEHASTRWLVECPWCNLSLKLASIRSWDDPKGGS
jgi:ribosomal protein L37E